MTNRSEQLSEKLRKLEYPSESGRMFDQIAPCTDQEVGDANNELVDELENILRGEAGEGPTAPEQEHDLPQPFPLAEPEPDEFAEDHDAVAPMAFSSPIADGTAWDDADEPWTDEAVDSDLDSAGFDAEPGLPKTRYGSPTPKFWDGDDLTQGLEEEEESRPRLTRPRDIVTVALLLLLVGGGATFSAIQLTRAPVMVASADGEAPEVAMADAAGLPGAAAAAEPAALADAATPEEPATDDAGLPDPVIVNAADAPPIGVDQPAGIVADAADEGPALGAMPDEPQIAEQVQGPGPAPGGNDPGATVNPAPPAANGGAPIMAFADPGVGGPMVADPLAVLSAPEGGAAAASTTRATANSWVNMRAGPDNGAAVITVVAEGATVNIIECDGWCNVVVDGVEGWIYQSFLNR